MELHSFLELSCTYLSIMLFNLGRNRNVFVAVPNVAGGDSAPMDEETMYQPVAAYFTFIQNNMSQITSGNTLQVMREAEQRHLQIMHGVVDSIRSEWSG